MKYHLRDIVDSMDFNELTRMKKDIDNGGLHLKKFLETKIKEREKKHEKYCSTCATELKPENTNNFTLVFGPDDFRKKASFCGTDCLEYFLKELKQIKKVRR